MGKMAVKEKEENLKSKTSTTTSSHGPTLSSEGCRVVGGGRRVELLQRLLPQVFSGDPLFYFPPNNSLDKTFMYGKLLSLLTIFEPNFCASIS